MSKVVESFDQKTERVAGVINEWIREHRARGDKGGLQALATKIKSLLRAEKIVVKQRMRPSACGVHPYNRGREMLIPIDVQDLIEAILEASFSWEEVQNAMCIEIAPQNEYNQEF